MTLTGDQIYRLLNQQWQEQGGQTHVRFLQISGLEYSWDDRRPAGDKVVEVRLKNGAHVDRNTSYTVVANIFIATGGDNFTVFKEANDQQIDRGGLDALVEYAKSLSQPFGSKATGRARRLDLRN